MGLPDARSKVPLTALAAGRMPRKGQEGSAMTYELGNLVT